MLLSQKHAASSQLPLLVRGLVNTAMQQYAQHNRITAQNHAAVRDAIQAQVLQDVFAMTHDGINDARRMGVMSEQYARNLGQMMARYHAMHNRDRYIDNGSLMGMMDDPALDKEAALMGNFVQGVRNLAQGARGLASKGKNFINDINGVNAANLRSEAAQWKAPGSVAPGAKVVNPSNKTINLQTGQYSVSPQATPSIQPAAQSNAGLAVRQPTIAPAPAQAAQTQATQQIAPQTVPTAQRPIQNPRHVQMNLPSVQEAMAQQAGKPSVQPANPKHVQLNPQATTKQPVATPAPQNAAKPVAQTQPHVQPVNNSPAGNQPPNTPAQPATPASPPPGNPPANAPSKQPIQISGLGIPKTPFIAAGLGYLGAKGIDATQSVLSEPVEGNYMYGTKGPVYHNVSEYGYPVM